MDSNLYEYYKHKKNALNIDKIRAIGYDILDAINYMHAKSIFHRDIKP
jgi:serine/threonine protein kinase